MDVAHLFRLASLLRRISRPARPPRPDPRVVERPAIAVPGSGAVYDLYEPRGRRIGSVVAVHGVTLQGARDPRLGNFARSLARLGVACAMPALPALADCRWDTRDLDHLESVVAHLAADPDHRPGLMGFSYGGSYALVAASRPSISDRIRFAVCLGAYHSLENLFDWYIEAGKRAPGSEKEWDNVIYRRLVMAYQQRQTLPLPETLLSEVKSLLVRYSNGATPEEKHRFDKAHLRRLDLFSGEVASRDHRVLEALSPARNLAGIRCPVRLIHDRLDTVVPPVHSERIFAELRALPSADSHTLLITPLISHVSLKGFSKIGEVQRLCASIAPLVSAG